MNGPRIVALVMALASAPAWATTARRLSDEALVDHSELIVVGRAGEPRSAWVGRHLVTLVTVSVSEALKGAPGSTVTVALPGGVDARRKFPVAMVYPWAPTIGANEEVLLFLGAGGDAGGAYTIAGFSQGKFSVMENEQGEKLVSRDLTGLELHDRAGLARGTRTLESLADFKRAIRAYLFRRTTRRNGAGDATE